AEVARQLLLQAAARPTLEILHRRLLLDAQLFVLALAIFFDHHALVAEIQLDGPAKLLGLGEVGVAAKQLVILIAVQLHDARLPFAGFWGFAPLAVSQIERAGADLANVLVGGPAFPLAIDIAVPLPRGARAALQLFVVRGLVDGPLARL